MPNRILRDAALDSDRIAAVSEAAEVLFYRLLMLADDFGRFDGRLSVIRARAFALRQAITEEEVEARLSELSQEGLIYRYEVESKPYLVIPRFGQRQRADKSKFPNPPVNGQSNDGHLSGIGQTSAPVVVVEDDIRRRSRDSAPSAPAARGETDRKPWWHSEAGIRARGQAIGMKAVPGESWAQYKDRIFERLNLRTHAREQGPAEPHPPATPPALDPDQGFPLKRKGKFDDPEPEEKSA